jgi:hypothetical protein
MRDITRRSSPAPPVTPEQIAPLPPEFQAQLESVINHDERRTAELEARLAALQKTPHNSSLPQSQAGPRPAYDEAAQRLPTEDVLGSDGRSPTADSSV